MDWRGQQLSAFKEPVLIRQDHELIEYLRLNNIGSAVTMGDVSYFSPYVEFTSAPADFGIYFVTEPFDFHELVDAVDKFINQYINPRGTLYLAINKFLAKPVCVMPHTVDYDQAILAFFEQRSVHTVEQYRFFAEDDGSYFNFVHPLTRFYLKHAGNRPNE